MELIATLHNVTSDPIFTSAFMLFIESDRQSSRQLWGPAFPDRIFTIDYGDWRLERDFGAVSYFTHASKSDECLVWHWDSSSGVRLNDTPPLRDLPNLLMQCVSGALFVTWGSSRCTLLVAPLLSDPLASPPGILPNDAPLVPLRQVLAGAEFLYVVPPLGSDVHPPLIVAGAGTELYQLDPSRA